LNDVTTYTNGQTNITDAAFPDWTGVAAHSDADGDGTNDTTTITWTYGGTDTADVAAPDGSKQGKDAVAAVYEIDLSDWDGTSKLTVGGTDYDDLDALATALETANAGYTASVADGKITLTAGTAGAIGTSGPAAAATASVTYGSKASETALTGIASVTKEGQTGGEIKGITEGANGDWNVSTTDIKNVTAEGVDRLASTYFDLTEDIASEGSQIRIGDDVYTFTSDKSKIGQTGFVDISSGDLDKIAKNLTDAAASNAVYSVGHDGKRITVTEQTTYDNDTGNYDLRTEEGIEKSLGFTAGSTVKGTGLMLQIGDTSDKFNQLTVGIGDMHTKAMVDENGVSIADIDISTQEGAQKAVDTIKSAINYVSSVRGDLGAISNRLDHTANNLSVMRENIQDAESTIRDTDIAEEMMSYTKNNILVQSAQAMLAQANQVPQGVLQLLQ
jgi:flagellin